MLIRLHHVVADGMAALAMLAPLFEPADSGNPVPSPVEDEWREPPIFGDRFVSALRAGRQLVALLPARIRQLARLLQEARAPDFRSTSRSGRITG